jgi:glycosyltransferase involved in cell wall biosynthesis
MRVGIYENLANNNYNLATQLRRLGHPVDLVLDPLDQHVMSNPCWEELDLELPTDQLVDPPLPDCQLPEWVRDRGTTPRVGGVVPAGRIRRSFGTLRDGIGLHASGRLALRRAGLKGAWLAAQRAWVVHTLSEYDCLVTSGMGPAWAALAGAPFVAYPWGGDMTMIPFYDTGDWEGHDTLPLPGPRRELFAQAKLQRLGYERASRLVLADPRLVPLAARLGHAAKSVEIGLFIDVEKYAPEPEPELRDQLLGGRDGLVVFVPARQDWYWKGSDRLLRGFAQAAENRPDAILVCAGWGADLEGSRRLISELGIGERVHLLSHAMSKRRLRRYYCAADVVADQFTVGSYGASALEAMGCERPVLISLEGERFARQAWSLPPVMNVSSADEIAAALRQLFDDTDLRRRLGGEARRWVVEHHGPPVAERVIDLCTEALAERAAGTSNVKL